MSTPSNQWYVEMSAGITLGPMPFDAIVELAETSAIMRGDRVREESSKEWRPASEIKGLFADEALLDSGSEDSGSEVVSLSGSESTETSAEAATPESAKSDEPVASTETTDGVVRLGGFEVLLGESETATTDADDPASALLRAAAGLETVDPADVPPEEIESTTKAKADQHKEPKPEFNLKIPDDAIPHLDTPAEASPRDDVKADSGIRNPKATASTSGRAPSQAQTTAEQDSLATSSSGSPQSTQAESVKAENVESDTREERAPLNLASLMSEGVDDKPAAPPPVAAHPPFKPPVKPWRPPDNRNRKLAIRGCLGLAAVAGVWALFAFLKPDVELATYDQYAAIYLEYQTLTESPDSGSWSEFTTRAKAELDETLPQLEASAGPGERSKSLLLYAGRDLRTAIELTPGTENPHAERLAGFFEQLNGLHASSQ